MDSFAPRFTSPFSGQPVASTSTTIDCSYSPKSSPQSTPTPESVAAFSNRSQYPAYIRDRTISSSSVSSQASFAMSDASAASSATSIDDKDEYEYEYEYEDEDETCTSSSDSTTIAAKDMSRTSSCYYAPVESMPRLLRPSTMATGGTGMVRSYSTPVAPSADFLARQLEYIAECKALAAAALPNMPRRGSKTTDSIECLQRSPSPWTARDIHNHPYAYNDGCSVSRPGTPNRARPGLGRFQSFEPALLATEFARSGEMMLAY